MAGALDIFITSDLSLVIALCLQPPPVFPGVQGRQTYAHCKTNQTKDQSYEKNPFAGAGQLVCSIGDALRRIKPEKRTKQMTVRPLDARLMASAVPIRPTVLVPDTCAYIHAAGGRLPPSAKALLEAAIQYHAAQNAIVMSRQAPCLPVFIV